MPVNFRLGNVRNTQTLALILLLASTNTAYAAGFALNNQSVTYLGTAYAGTSSTLQDASTGYYNPAGLSELSHSQVLISGAYAFKRIKIYNARATNSIGTAITGNNPTKPKANFFELGSHITWRATDKLSVGLSLVEPFGQDIRYNVNDIVRLMSLTSKITTFDISPTIGYKFNKDFSVGAGLDFMKVNSTLISKVSWANNQPESNGFLSTTGSAWTIGYHIGILFTPWRDARAGLVYYSHFTPKFDGFVGYEQVINFGTPSKFSYTMKLPDRLNFSLTQKFTSKLQAMAEVEWTHWSRFKNIVVNYDSNALPGLLSYYLKNTWRVSLGSVYSFNSNFDVRVGVGYDKTPTNNQFRNAMLPDNSRYLLAIGAKYAIKNFIITAGYAHSFYPSTYISAVGANNALNRSAVVANQSTLNAAVKNVADTVGIQIAWNFAKAPKKQERASSAPAKAKAKNKNKSKSKSKKKSSN